MRCMSQVRALLLKSGLLSRRPISACWYSPPRDSSSASAIITDDLANNHSSASSLTVD